MYVPMTPARVLVSMVAIVPLIGLWTLIPQPSKLVGEQEMEGTILTVTSARMKSKFGDSSNTHVAQVELPDGGKARVWLRNSSYRSGDVIEVRVRRFDDGHREVVPAY